MCCSFTRPQTPSKGCTGGTWRHRCLQGHHEDGHRPGLPDGRSEGAEKKYAGAALQGGWPECEEGAACYFFEQVASNRPAHLAASPQPHRRRQRRPGISSEGRHSSEMPSKKDQKRVGDNYVVKRTLCETMESILRKLGM